MMPFDAVVLSIAVTAVFIGFAGVLAWADFRTQPSQPDAPAPKRRRSF
jgi:hypothetical protein